MASWFLTFAEAEHRGYHYPIRLSCKVDTTISGLKRKLSRRHPNIVNVNSFTNRSYLVPKMSTILRTLRYVRRIGLKVCVDVVNREKMLISNRNMAAK